MAMHIGVARVQRRVWTVSAVLGSICVLVVGLSVPLLPVLGVDAVGWAWLASQTLVAGIVWRTGLRPLWKAQAARVPEAPGSNRTWSATG